MRPASTAQATVAPADAAVVVFVRTSRVGPLQMFTIIDGNGRFLGDAQAGGRFAVTLPPGEHLFLTWGETTGPMRANLAPGRVYFVEVSPRVGAFRARVDLLAVAPRTERWKELTDMIADSELLEPDQTKGQASLASKQDKVRKRIQSAKETLVELDKEELLDRTLFPEDGVPSQGLTRPSSPPAEPSASGSGLSEAPQQQASPPATATSGPSQ